MDQTSKYTGVRFSKIPQSEEEVGLLSQSEVDSDYVSFWGKVGQWVVSAVEGMKYVNTTGLASPKPVSDLQTFSSIQQKK